MITITQLKYIIALDELKHFGKAASKSNVSQPSLSAQIQKVEELLGVVLFDRSKKPILTTQTGKLLITQAKIVLREHARLQEISFAQSQEIQGVFNLAIIPTLSPYLLPLFLRQFSKNYPKVRLIIHEHKTEEIVELLSRDQIDAALLVSPLKNNQIIERHLFFEPFSLFSSKDHPLIKKSKISEIDLSTKGLWLLEEGHCFRNQVLKVCRSTQQSSVLENVSFESGNLETLKNLVKKNSGYTLLPFLAVENLSNQEKKNHIKEFKSPVPTREISLVHSRSFLKENIINALEENIIKNIPSQLYSLKRKNLSILDIN